MQPSIKGRYPIAQRQQPQQVNFGAGIGELSLLLMQLQGLKKEIIDIANKKLAEVDDRLQAHIKTIVDSTAILENTHNKVVDYANRVQKGAPGKDADEIGMEKRLTAKIPAKDKIVQEVLAQIPKIDEDKIVRKTLKAIPENKASLKIIQENFEVDPMSVIEKIMALPPEKLKKLKLKKENIDGLEQTMSAFSNQLGRGYLHGGGTTVAAGTNITLVPNANGTTTINATGGVSVLTVTGIVNGSNTSFTVASLPSIVVSDGVAMQALDNNGNTQWSYTGTTLTMQVPPTNAIYAYS